MIEAIQMNGLLQLMVHDGARLRAITRRTFCKLKLHPRAHLGHTPLHPMLGKHIAQTIGQLLCQRQHVRISSGRHHLFQIGAHRGKCQGIGGERGAYATVPCRCLLFHLLCTFGNVGAHAIHRTRHTATQRLAQHQHIGL